MLVNISSEGILSAITNYLISAILVDFFSRKCPLCSTHGLYSQVPVCYLGNIVYDRG